MRERGVRAGKMKGRETREDKKRVVQGVRDRTRKGKEWTSIEWTRRMLSNLAGKSVSCNQNCNPALARMLSMKIET